MKVEELINEYVYCESEYSTTTKANVWLWDEVNRINITTGEVPKKYLKEKVISFRAIGKNLISITIAPEKEKKQLSMFDYDIAKEMI